MKNTYPKVKGFTLVELLVVIAIIASLAVMATPVILKSLTKAKIVTAQNVCVSLESAVDRFENDYSFLPYDPDSAPDGSDDTPEYQTDSTLMAVLVGVEKEEGALNYKFTEYFSLNEPKGTAGNYKDGLKVDRTGNTALLYDAWGQPYYMAFDFNLDGYIEHPFDSTKELSGKKVLVYSLGPDFEKKDEVGDKPGIKVMKRIPKNF